MAVARVLGIRTSHNGKLQQFTLISPNYAAQRRMTQEGEESEELRNQATQQCFSPFVCAVKHSVACEAQNVVRGFSGGVLV